MSPRLSVVLPAYGVEAFLPECLESLRAGTADEGEVELIGVDDRSPDACGAILDAHAARDPRLRVLHLASNVGLGGAREAGLAEAAGRYVWFVDTDDRLPDGALDAVLAGLRAEDQRVARGEAPLDVLLTDFTHVYSDGSTEPNPWRHVLAGSPLEAGATAADHPALFSSVMTVWNKVFRREFLLGLGVAFGRGWYEDISVTYPALLAARRLRYLDTPCYTYRRGRPGAITATASPRHTEVFAQYDAVFAFLDRAAVPAALRTVVFDRTVKHALTTYDTPELVPDALRDEFFARVADHFRRHRPPGYRFPSGPRGVQYRLAARGARHAYDAVRTAGRRARAAVPPARRTARRVARAAASAAYRRLPLDENLAVYAAYWHRGYACNPAAIHAKALELAPHIRGVWVLADAARAAALPPGVPYVVVNTPAYLKAMATAKYRVNNVNWPFTSGKRPGSVHVQTQHGTPLKTMGLDQRAYPATSDGMDFDRLLANVARWDYLLSPNPYTSEVWRRAYPGRYELLELGYPRNDRLVTATAAECAKVRAALGLEPGRRVALYAPTHRGASAGYVPLLDLAALAGRLGPDWTVLVRAHYFHGGGVGEATHRGGDAAQSGAGATLADVSGHGCVEDLYLAADALVTDYSSTMFDYVLLDRPVVVFAPDWEDYRAARGVYFDLPASPPGAVATTTEEVADALLAGDPAPAARAAFRARFCPWDDGHAAERVVRRVFGLPPGQAPGGGTR